MNPTSEATETLATVDRIALPYEYQYVFLPPLDSRPMHGESRVGQINRLLAELVHEGWEPLSLAPGQNQFQCSFLLRRATP